MTSSGSRPSRRRRLVLAIAAILLLIIPWLACILFSNARAVPSRLGPSTLLFPFGNPRQHLEPHGYVAHALGEIDGIFYTNSLEAFELNYENGFTTFEVDLVLLKDGSAFCAHDGMEWMYGLDKPFAETTPEEMSGRLCLGKYTPLTGSELLDLAYEHEDVCFFVDTKRTTARSSHDILEALVSEAEARHPSVLDRMIPHTFGPADMCEVAGIHAFRDYWLAVYSFKHNMDKDSGMNSDRVVVYLLSDGGPARFLRLADVSRDPAILAEIPIAFLSQLQCPGLGLLSPLSGLRVYFSIDSGAISPDSD